MKIEKCTRIQVRSDKKLKDDATAVLEELGLDMTTAVNLFLRQVVNGRSLPFRPSLPDPSDPE